MQIVNLLQFVEEAMFLRKVIFPRIRTKPYCTHEAKTETPAIGKLIVREPPVEKLTRGESFNDPGQPYHVPIKFTTIDVRYASGFHKEPQLGLIQHVVLSTSPESCPKAPSTVSPSLDGPGNRSIPRPVRLEPGPTFFHLIPKGWVKSFNPKTGITGFWTFAFTTGTFLFSKEIWVTDHEFYNGLSAVLLCYVVVKYAGPDFAKAIDKGVDEYEAHLTNTRTSEIEDIQNQIKFEETSQLQFAEQSNLVQAKREMVDLQLEDEFRKRQFAIYTNVRNKLDYQVAVEDSRRRFAHENMVQWLVNQVTQSITDEFDAKYFDLKVKELELLGQSRL